MTSRELDDAASRLEQIQQRRRARLLLSAPAAAFAAGALPWSGALAIALACGVVCLLALALADTVRRRELIATLALNPGAYSVPEVRRYGAGLVMLRGRQRVAAALERVLTHAGTPGSYYLADRVHKCRHEIRDLAEVLRAPGTRAEPASVALCWRLLRCAADSPLYNWHLPAEDLRVTVRRIRAGIRRSPAAES